MFAHLVLGGLFLVLASFCIVTGFSMTHDAIEWHGAFHYFYASIARGVMPYWNPYSQTGTPFFNNFQSFGFLDPSQFFFILLQKLSGCTTLTTYVLQYLFRYYVFIIGAYATLRVLTRHTGSSLLFSLVLFFACFPIFMRQNGALNPFFLIPLITCFLLLFFQTSTPDKKGFYLVVVSFLCGVSLNIHIPMFLLFYLLLFIVLIFVFKITNIRRTLRFFMSKWGLLWGSLSIIVVLLMCSPVVALYDELHNNSEYFPSVRLLQHNGNHLVRFYASDLQEDFLAEDLSHHKKISLTMGNFIGLLFEPFQHFIGSIQSSEVVIYPGIISLICIWMAVTQIRNRYIYLFSAIAGLILLISCNFKAHIHTQAGFTQRLLLTLFPFLKMSDVLQNGGTLLLFCLITISAIGFQKIPGRRTRIVQIDLSRFFKPIFFGVWGANIFLGLLYQLIVGKLGDQLAYYAVYYHRFLFGLFLIIFVLIVKMRKRKRALISILRQMRKVVINGFVPKTVIFFCITLLFYILSGGLVYKVIYHVANNFNLSEDLRSIGKAIYYHRLWSIPIIFIFILVVKGKIIIHTILVTKRSILKRQLILAFKKKALIVIRSYKDWVNKKFQQNFGIILILILSIKVIPILFIKDIALLSFIANPFLFIMIFIFTLILGVLIVQKRKFVVNFHIIVMIIFLDLLIFGIVHTLDNRKVLDKKFFDYVQAENLLQIQSEQIFSNYRVPFAFPSLFSYRSSNHKMDAYGEDRVLFDSFFGYENYKVQRVAFPNVINFTQQRELDERAPLICLWDHFYMTTSYYDYLMNVKYEKQLVTSHIISPILNFFPKENVLFVKDKYKVVEKLNESSLADLNRYIFIEQDRAVHAQPPEVSQFFNPDNYVTYTQKELSNFEQNLGVQYPGNPDVQINIVDYDINHLALNVKTPYDGYLYFGDGYSKHWKAFVDGQETMIEKTNINFKAVYTPTGKHTVELVFDPVLFRYSLYSYVLGNVLFFTIFIVLQSGVLRKKRYAYLSINLLPKKNVQTRILE